MRRAYLLIQTVSYDHIALVSRYIHKALLKNFGPGAELVVCDQIDDVDYTDGAVIFVIGEGFKRHRRRTGCIYVFLNFSIVAAMGNPLHQSKVGLSAIRRKRRMLAERLADFDVLLDYFGPQTARLQRRLDIPVFGFSVALDPEDIGPPAALDDRIYDICFVGAMTPRRQLVIDQLGALGFRTSPHKGVVHEIIAAQSRVCINIHAYRSNHLETPRIVGAIAAGTPVVTETSYGLQTLVSPDLVTEVPFRHFAKVVQNLCEDKAWLRRNQVLAQTWYRQVYLPQCNANWADICRKINDIAG